MTNTKSTDHPALTVHAKSILSSTSIEKALEQAVEDQDFGMNESSGSAVKEVRFRTMTSMESIIPDPPEDVIPQDDWENIAYFARYWDLDFSQGSALTELRDKIQDVDHNYNRPNVVIRYLRTQKFNVAKAEKMFRDSIAWREQHGVDTMVHEYKPPEELLEKYPGAILAGRDKDGDPVFMSRMGVTDISGMLKKYGHADMLRYEIYKRESALRGTWLKEWQEESRRPIRQLLVIEDLDGLSRKIISSKVAALYGDAMHLDQNNYPDSAKKIIIIRTPAIFRAVWALVKRFFPDFMQQKMEFAGYHNYLQVLEKYLDLEILPPCVNPDGKGQAVPDMPPNFDGGKV
jgi:hypothetical protein